MTQTELIQIFMGFLGTFGFSILFNIRGKRLAMAAFGGFLSWALFVLLGNVIESEPVRYFLVSGAISLYAEIMARMFKTPTTTVLMTALIPLVPGASLYYTMAYALENDLEKFLSKAVYTLQLAGALALGIVITTMVVRSFNTVKKENRYGKCETIYSNQTK